MELLKLEKSGNDNGLSPKKPNKVLHTAGKTILIALKVLGTALLILLTTSAVFICLFAVYVKTTIQSQLDITLEDYAIEQTSYLYYDDGNGDSQEWTDIMSTIKREWIDYEDIPQYMIDATVAIEDKRFYEHDGVDWYRTSGAMITMLTSEKTSSFGASTITQQLIKNLTGDDDVTVKRKIIEIFRALEVEKYYVKDEIITWYLNIIYLGENSYGVQAASNVYFGKDAKDLTLAECACIVGITNRPTAYDPYLSLTANKERQEVILKEMYDQDYITRDEYEQALNEELNFVRGDDYETTDYIYSYYQETAINDAIELLMNENNLSEEVAKTKVYYGGYHIYTCIDMDIQSKLDSIYTDLSNIPATYGNSQQLQSAMTIQDPNTGKIVALVGGVGEKDINFGFNRATNATRAPGSSIKPLSVYGPGLDTGTITASSTYIDSPITINGKQWPQNDNRKWSNSSYTITAAVQRSVNTIAVKVVQDVGLDVSYSYLQDNLGITTLVADQDRYLAPLALGQLTKGVTVREMTNAYAAIANGGTLIESKTVSKICDSEGKLVIDNSEPESSTAFATSTTDTLTALLYNAVKNGTGTAAKLSSGMAVAGKTGTTGDNNDRWFCGYTPYYVAACWTGYDQQASIKLVNGGNPAAQLWNKVMTLIHEDLETISTFTDKSDGSSETATTQKKSSESPSASHSPSPSTLDDHEENEKTSEEPSASEKPSPSPSQQESIAPSPSPPPSQQASTAPEPSPSPSQQPIEEQVEPSPSVAEPTTPPQIGMDD